MCDVAGLGRPALGFWCVGWLPESLGLLDQSSEFEGGTPVPIFRHVHGYVVSRVCLVVQVG